MGGVLHTDFTHIEALNIKTSNTLTTSSAGGSLGNHHANMVMEIITMSKKDNIKVLGIMEGGYEMPNRVYDDTGISPSIRTFQGGGLEPKVIQIRQATKEGTIPCLIGGVADLNYPTSKTRRGRVIDMGMTSPTLTTEGVPSVLEDWTWDIDGVTYLIRIRKLTPKECWRLMGFTDEDFEKAEAVNSNTQLYKQAGNSIVKNVLCEIFKQFF